MPRDNRIVATAAAVSSAALLLGTILWFSKRRRKPKHVPAPTVEAPHVREGGDAQHNSVDPVEKVEKSSPVTPMTESGAGDSITPVGKEVTTDMSVDGNENMLPENICEDLLSSERDWATLALEAGEPAADYPQSDSQAARSNVTDDEKLCTITNSQTLPPLSCEPASNTNNSNQRGVTPDTQERSACDPVQQLAQRMAAAPAQVALESPTEKLMNSSVSSSQSGHSERSGDSGKASSVSEPERGADRATPRDQEQLQDVMDEVPAESPHVRRGGVLRRRRTPRRRHTPSPEPEAEWEDQPQSVYEFDIASENCGMLIGRKGKMVNNLRSTTRTEIVLMPKPGNSEFETCRIQGLPKDVRRCVRLIERRFPNLDTTRNVMKTDIPAVMPSCQMQLSLPEGVTFDVMVSSVLNANHVFVQQPTHGSFPKLEDLNRSMALCYADSERLIPQLPRPIDAGVICVAPLYNGWCRVQVTDVFPETDEYDIKFLDYGGYMRMPGCQLKQIRSDFMTLPFLACECYLSNLAPPDESGYSSKANPALEKLVTGQVLKAQIIGYNDFDVPFVQLFRYSREEFFMINRKLVEDGWAMWEETELAEEPQPAAQDCAEEEE